MASTSAILALASHTPAAEPFDITRELAPVSLIAAPPYILVVNPSVPAKNAAELIAYARSNPGKLSYGSSGAGSASHLSGALFAQMAGIDMLHVPYRGTGPAVTDLLGGRIELMFSPALVVTPHIAAGTLRVIGTTGAARSALFPDSRRSPKPASRATNRWAGSACSRPAATPRGHRRADQRGRAHACSASGRPRSGSPSRAPSPRRARPAAFAAFVNADVAKWLELAQKAGIKLGGVTRRTGAGFRQRCQPKYLSRIRR